MVTFRTFSEIPLQDTLAAWNAGFQDYYANLQMDCRTFLGRFHREDLLPEESIMLYADGQAVGFTLNGLRTVNGETMAWNGGTAVLPAYRGQGMGGRLLEENIRRYKLAGAQTARLEAFVQNEPAIALYEKHGYRGQGTTLFYALDGEPSFPAAPEQAWGSGEEAGLQIRECAAAEAAVLPFYDYSGPWQTHWPSLKDGRCLIAEQNGAALGYVQFRRGYAGTGQLSGIQLYPGKLRDDLPERGKLIHLLLSRIFSYSGSGVSLSTVHTPAADSGTRGWLEAAGFSVRSELVHMERVLD
ncbi:GNAT family N-acetyltransferase [Paenibacillus sonchi]|uniref:GNAT family N-acetyltransferase n=1 Tax=Paenibacillus sonchi TaxID=373687 RepID=A0A974PFA4_9BACL|nr:GNAT family N-acetyltransferase [Paenibacillus sonchi]QQZ62393.1 GNAT family N-acetyltransferase [Paenibacillus sonchi]